MSKGSHQYLSFSEGFIHRLAAPTIVFLCLLLLPASAEKRVALVIGNNHYSNLSQLNKAVSDAAAVGETLEELGFEVIRGVNLGRQAMIDKLAEFTTRLDAGDTALFFFAGHGVAIGGVNYLIPTDVPPVASGAEARVRGASISEPEIISEIQSRGTRVAIMVLDACRDNPFPRVGTRTLGHTRGLAEARPGRGVFTFYSAGIAQQALDELHPGDKNPNSVFTRVFVEQLRQAHLHLAEMAVEVRERVAQTALDARNSRGEPEPHEQTPAYYDQTVGGRIFLKRPARFSNDVRPENTNTPPELIVFYATKSGGVAEDGSGPNSVFTTALLKHLGTRVIDVHTMMKRVTDEVLRTTGNRQEPFSYGTGGSGKLTLSTLQEAQGAKKVALVIGNGSYETAPLLPSAKVDASSMSSLLKNAGFDVSEATDLGERRLKQAIEQFQQASSGADYALIFYSGHGFEVNGVNYLAPIDARVTNREDFFRQTISLQSLIAATEPARRLRFIILDSNRDNPFPQQSTR